MIEQHPNHENRSAPADDDTIGRGHDRIQAGIIALCLCFFGLPLGIGNALAQPIAFLLLAPIVVSASRGINVGLLMASAILAYSAVRMISDQSLEHSTFQMFRSGMPFLYLCVIIGGFGVLQRKIILGFNRKSISAFWNRSMIGAIYAFAGGQLLQVLLFQFGVARFANASLVSGDQDRLFLVQTPSSLILLYFAVCSSRIGLAAVLTIIILASGSKATLAAMVALFLLASIRRGLGMPMFASLAMGLVGVISITVISPQSYTRIVDYFSVSQGIDITRRWEIDQAKTLFASSGENILFGVGLGSAITEGVQTTDPRWFENSKYDIENGYWSLLVKLGIVGTAALVLLGLALPRSHVTLALLVIESLWALGSPSLFFTNFDGAYLLVWAVVISVLLKRGEHPTQRKLYEAIPLQ